MQIVQIDIDNFKSFAEKTCIPFRRGFTTISGPNGSGKSNIVDSILFCLGLSSSRVLRAEKLTDLINNLSSKRREAIVRISFGSADENAGIEDDITPQFWISRRIRENTGGYTSTYYLNDKPCTLGDVHDYLAQYHISPGCYNVMMQGDVAGIVNMSPGERRKILDEMAGIGEFDRKIDQAQNELTTTFTNIERNQVLLTELTERLGQLAKERETALRYQSLKQERQTLERQLIAIEAAALTSEVARMRAGIGQVEGQQKEKKAQIANFEGQVKAKQGELAEVNLAIQRKGEDQYLAIRKQIEGLKGHISRREDSIKHIATQVADHAQQRAQMTQETGRQQDQHQQIALIMGTLTDQIRELETYLSTEQKTYTELQQQLDALISDTQATERLEIRSQLEVASDGLAALRRQELDAMAALDRLKQQNESQQAEVQQHLARKAGLCERLDNLKPRVEAASLTLQTSQTAAQNTQYVLSETRVQLKGMLIDYEHAQKQLMQLNAQKRAYEDMNFGRAVDTIIRSDMQGVHGTLAQLGKVPDHYGVALEIAMGGRMQHIVVDDERVGQAGIELLKKRGAGRATFLPLTKIQRSRGLPAAPRNAGVVDFAFNLLEFDSAFEDVFAFALGDTLIVERLEDARPLMRQYRMVTLDGSLLEKSGAMTGGSSPQRSGVKFSNAQGVEVEIERQQQQVDALQEQKQGFEIRLQDLETQLQAHQRDATLHQQNLVRLSAEQEALDAQLAQLTQTLQAQEIATATHKYNDADLLALRQGIQKAEADVARWQETLDQLDAQFPGEQIDSLRVQLTDQKFQVDYYDTQKRNVETELKARQLEQNHHTQALQHYEERLQALTTQDVSLLKDRAQYEEEIQVTQKQLAQMEAQTALIDEELKGMQQERERVQGELLDLEKQKHGMDRALQQLADQVLGFNARIRELTPKLQQLNAQLQGETFESLPDRETAQRRLKTISDTMTQLEPVNMKAIQDYEEVFSRHNELQQRIETLSGEREALMLRIAGYEDLKRVSFMQTFEQVDNHFKAIFAELSDGIGQLVLTDPEHPLNGGLTIQAQPRGKKMQRLEAMSGGEKSLTSLAFVFSLQRVSPAPFYALDEVDQNLDGMNAERLANLVKREAEHSQFVVVSLRKPMLSASNRTIGVTQKRDGITKVTGVLLRGSEPEVLPPSEAQALLA